MSVSAEGPVKAFPGRGVRVASILFIGLAASTAITPAPGTAPRQTRAAFAAPQATARVLSLATPITGTTRLIGSPNKDQLGNDLALGNLNGDGKADLVLGAHWSSDSGRNIVGRTYVTFGRDSWPASFDMATLSNRDWAFIGTGHEARMGTAVAVGDLDGDGLDDLIMGSLLADPKVSGDQLSNAGSVYIMYGSRTAGGAVDFRWDQPGSQLNGRSDNLASDQLGTTLVVGDWNHDQKPDLAVGAMFRPNAKQEERVGAVFVWWGPIPKGTTKNLISANADWTLLGATSNGYFGAALASGDLTGDGMDDLVVSALSDGPTTPNAEGAVYVFAGGPGIGGWTDLAKGGRPATLLIGEPDMALGTAFTLGSCSCRGQSLAVADFNGDRRADLAIGSPRDSAMHGAVLVIAGPLSAGTSQAAELASRRFAGSGSGDQLGWSVSAGDLDGDAQPDLLITAPKADAPKPQGGNLDAGAAVGLRGPLRAGPPITLTEASADLWVWGPLSSAGNAGMSAGIADSNGDGANDLHLGFPDAAPLTRNSSGAAYRLPGPLLSRLETPTPTSTATLPPTQTPEPTASAVPPTLPPATATASASPAPSIPPTAGPTGTRPISTTMPSPSPSAPAATKTSRTGGRHQAYLPKVLRAWRQGNRRSSERRIGCLEHALH